MFIICVLCAHFLCLSTCTNVNFLSCEIVCISANICAIVVFTHNYCDFHATPANLFVKIKIIICDSCAYFKARNCNFLMSMCVCNVLFCCNLFRDNSGTIKVHIWVLILGHWCVCVCVCMCMISECTSIHCLARMTCSTSKWREKEMIKSIFEIRSNRLTYLKPRATAGALITFTRKTKCEMCTKRAKKKRKFFSDRNTNEKRELLMLMIRVCMVYIYSMHGARICGCNW